MFGEDYLSDVEIIEEKELCKTPFQITFLLTIRDKYIDKPGYIVEKIFIPPSGIDVQSLVKQFDKAFDIWNALNESYYEILKPLQCNASPISTSVHANTTFSILTEFCENGNLRDYLKTHELSFELILELFFQILHVIGALHNNGIAHGDIKPENILFDKEQRLLVSECCINSAFAQVLLKNGIEIVTSHTAPEQIDYKKYEPIDMQTDIWQLGCLFYETITGKPLFKAKDSSSLKKSILTFQTLPPIENIQWWVYYSIKKALSQDKNHRWNNAWELYDFLSFYYDFEKNVDKSLSGIVSALSNRRCIFRDELELLCKEYDLSIEQVASELKRNGAFEYNSNFYFAKSIIETIIAILDQEKMLTFEQIEQITGAFDERIFQELKNNPTVLVCEITKKIYQRAFAERILNKIDLYLEDKTDPVDINEILKLTKLSFTDLKEILLLKRYIPIMDKYIVPPNFKMGLLNTLEKRLKVDSETVQIKDKTLQLYLEYKRKKIPLDLVADTLGIDAELLKAMINTLSLSDGYFYFSHIYGFPRVKLTTSDNKTYLVFEYEYTEKEIEEIEEKKIIPKISSKDAFNLLASALAGSLLWFGLRYLLGFPDLYSLSGWVILSLFLGVSTFRKLDIEKVASVLMYILLMVALSYLLYLTKGIFAAVIAPLGITAVILVICVIIIGFDFDAVVDVFADIFYATLLPLGVPVIAFLYYVLFILGW